jgi:hypothetical protein
MCKGAAVAIFGAAAYVCLAAVTGALAGSMPVASPKQLVGAAPWVSDVSLPLLALLVGVGASFADAISFAWVWALTKGLRRRARTTLFAAAGAGLLVAAWSALYASTFGPGDPVIPILNWTWPAATTAVAAGVVASCHGVRAGLVAGLVTVAPIAALDALGWSLGIGPADALLNVLFLDGFGIAIGSLLAVTGSGRTDSRSAPLSP